MAERLTEIYSLLLPLTEGRLIVPRACVAEVIAFATPVEMAGAPAWYLGSINWTGRIVPLISFEAACGLPIPPVSGRSRIVIFHCLGTDLEVGCFGVLSQGFPQLIRVTTDVIRPDNSHAIPERWPVICQVRMMNEAPYVPDLERIEKLIADETSVAA